MLARLAKFLLPVNGLVGLAALLAFVAWIADNAARQVCIGYEQIALFGGLLTFLLEINRRSPAAGA